MWLRKKKVVASKSGKTGRRALGFSSLSEGRHLRSLGGSSLQFESLARGVESELSRFLAGDPG